MSAATTYVLAIDQGTTSTRAMVFDRDGAVVATDQIEHEQIFPRAGWVEHDALEIWGNTRRVIGGALGKANLNSGHIEAVGITNQRETTVVWEKATGQPIHHAVVWQDTRTQGIVDELAADGGLDRFKEVCGLPLATYFAGPKIAWILDHVEGARERAEAGELLAGTMDTWVLWNLTGGGENDGVHVTDVTNASRTMLMDLRTLQWDEAICEAIGVPLQVLPEIRSSSEVYGECKPGVLNGTPIAGILGDQQSATFGQACLTPGTAKNTYGTGNFMLLNTGTEIVTSDNGLLTTVCYQLGDEPAVYALEGSIAVTGSLIQWLRDNLGFIREAPEVEQLAGTVEDNGGVYFVPAFSGLFAPHWRPDARGGDPRSDALRQQGPHRPGRARVDGLPDPRRARRDAGGCRARGRPAHGAQGRRRHGRQRDAHAVPGRHPRRRRRAPQDRRDHCARCCLRGRAGRRLLGVDGRDRRQLDRGRAVVPVDGRDRGRATAP
ncbi:glycerol kinase [Janibacter hoylei PVAS-1]|uniref:Glycerol kinase n=1 Tax=Janibacter hoylei PVAS-1 TaxID=1210046 RepID=K1E8L8_9MICO|nr:glycerol kinase [Janibacter hoylei PVAS-1]